MITSIPIKDIVLLIKTQLSNFFLLSTKESEVLESVFPEVLQKVDKCFLVTDNKYYNRLNDSKIVEGKESFFNPYHSCQYAIFLYILSRVVAERTKEVSLTDKIYYLNRTLNSVDLFHQIKLPIHWGCEHPLGSVMGRAQYGEGFFFYQGCTVGGNIQLQYPVIGENVKMYAHSQIIGNCHIGNNVLIGAGTLVKDQDIPNNSLVFGQSPNLIIKARK